MSKEATKVAVIGSGFSGLSAAAILAKEGCQVTIFEKNDSVGGRARELKLGNYTFEMGPSWYWMPDVFESFFNIFGKTTSDYYGLKRLDPAYRIFKGKDEFYDIPASFSELILMFEELEPGSGNKLEKFLEEAKIKYELGIGKFARKPCRSVTEYMEREILVNLFKLDLLKPISKSINTAFKNPILRELLKFPVLFLGARPEKIPALFSMLNYADLKLGTWYPEGGMYSVIRGFENVAIEQGVEIRLSSNVEEIIVDNKRCKALIVNGKKLNFDLILASSDYHHTENAMLKPIDRGYSKSYWQSRQLSPSSIMFYIGLNRKIPEIIHHNLFFDRDFNQHAKIIYDKPAWPEEPLFYASSPSKTDPTVAPQGCDNLVILIPIASGLQENNKTHTHYFDLVCKRFKHLTDFDIKEHMVEFQSFGVEDFKTAYNAFKGNAYGLANTFRQTAFFRPSIKSKKIGNLYFAGQLTVPGPGVPPAIISGEIVAMEMLKDLN